MHNVNTDEEDYRSRSVDKRAAEAAQKLGERLIGLRPEQLARLELPENLRDAIAQAKRLNSNGALRRQRQYIGKLMRHVELEPIEAKLAQWESARKAETVQFRRMERWRDRLLAQDSALEALIEAYPALDVQHVRNLIRNARRQQAHNQAPGSSRELFRYLTGLAAAERED
ncbi:MAG: DUF615 domain-containing protein [Thiothrix sp.]|nr:DUF615 domain-containing protein [Thiothrix sp.]HPE60317.1 ribosome biogenesis factor YjgA [Thiolinea sp.]